jgi:hypothetical protein
MTDNAIVNTNIKKYITWFKNVMIPYIFVVLIAERWYMIFYFIKLCENEQYNIKYNITINNVTKLYMA